MNMMKAKLLINGSECHVIYYISDDELITRLGDGLELMYLINYIDSEEFKFEVIGDDGEIIISGTADVQFVPKATIRVNDD